MPVQSLRVRVQFIQKPTLHQAQTINFVGRGRQVKWRRDGDNTPQCRHARTRGEAATTMFGGEIEHEIGAQRESDERDGQPRKLGPDPIEDRLCVPTLAAVIGKARQSHAGSAAA